MAHNPGDQICGRFELVRAEAEGIGSPLFGDSWAAVDSESGEVVRLVLLGPELIPEAAGRSALVDRLRPLCARGQDDVLVPLSFVGLDGDLVAAAFEGLYAAISLSDVVADLEVEDRLPELGRLIADLALGLAILHGRGHLHGSLGIETIFVWERGNALWQHALASGCDPAAFAARTAETGLHVAPEVAETGKVSAASDVFAWASVVATYASGLPPKEALEALGRGEILGKSGKLLELLQAAADPSPSARPANGSRLVEGLQAASLLIVDGEEECIDEDALTALAEAGIDPVTIERLPPEFGAAVELQEPAESVPAPAVPAPAVPASSPVNASLPESAESAESAVQAPAASVQDSPESSPMSAESAVQAPGADVQRPPASPPLSAKAATKPPPPPPKPPKPPSLSKPPPPAKPGPPKRPPPPPRAAALGLPPLPGAGPLVPPLPGAAAPVLPSRPPLKARVEEGAIPGIPQAPTPASAAPASPSAAPASPSASPVPPSASPVPPSASPVPPSASPVRPSASPVPPGSPVPPSASPVRPSASPVPPSAAEPSGDPATPIGDAVAAALGGALPTLDEELPPPYLPPIGEMHEPSAVRPAAVVVKAGGRGEREPEESKKRIHLLEPSGSRSVSAAGESSGGLKTSALVNMALAGGRAAGEPSQRAGLETSSLSDAVAAATAVQEPSAETASSRPSLPDLPDVPEGGRDRRTHPLGWAIEDIEGHPGATAPEDSGAEDSGAGDSAPSGLHADDSVAARAIVEATTVGQQPGAEEKKEEDDSRSLLILLALAAAVLVGTVLWASN